MLGTMLGVNRVILLGEISERPELRYTLEGSAVACFPITVCRAWSAPGSRAQKENETFNVVAWREMAERCEDELEPGTYVYLEGRLRNHCWRDALGRQMMRTEIIAERVFVLEPESIEDDNHADSHYDYEYQWRD
ncbi:MAG: single-stranded DNA-binding protein [Anaerolineae bacterium]